MPTARSPPPDGLVRLTDYVFFSKIAPSYLQKHVAQKDGNLTQKKRNPSLDTRSLHLDLFFLR